MFCSKHVDVKRHSVYFPEIKKNICRIFFGFEFISFPNSVVLSAVTCIHHKNYTIIQELKELPYCDFYRSETQTSVFGPFL